MGLLGMTVSQVRASDLVVSNLPDATGRSMAVWRKATLTILSLWKVCRLLKLARVLSSLQLQRYLLRPARSVSCLTATKWNAY